MTFEIFCSTYNDEWLVPKIADWYTTKLSGHQVIINLLDNESTDNTCAIGKELDCNIITWQSNGELRDDLGQELFNCIWKTSKADYVIMICADEFIDIDPKELQGATIYRCVAYNMIGDGTQNNLDDVIYGVRFEAQDKCSIFSPTDITNINYSPGFHYCNPKGRVKWDNYRPIMYHMNMLSEEWFVERNRRGRERLSKQNRDNGWGAHLGENDAEMRLLYQQTWGLKQKIR